MVKMKLTDNQTAFEYAAYVIASSYFDKTHCVSKLTEKRMRLQYNEQKADSQYRMENSCIRSMERICAKLPKKFFKQEMTVHLRSNDEGHIDIVFENGKYEACFKAKYAGKSSYITCHISKMAS